MMKARTVVIVSLFFLVLVVPMVTIVPNVYANPGANDGLGYISNVEGTSQDGNGMWIVVPSSTYWVVLSQMEFDHADISVHGSYTDGTPWVISFPNLAATGTSTPGWYYRFKVAIPANAGCTIVIHYYKSDSDGSGNPDLGQRHAADAPAAVWDPTVRDHGQGIGHLKTYYVGGGPVPCQVFSTPEFPLSTAAITSLGLIGALVIRRRQSKRA